MNPSALLVHGYLGAPAELSLAARALGEELGAERVRAPLLPGHGGPGVPPFEKDRLVEAVRAAAEELPGDAPVLVGHSAGGALALAAARALRRPPALVVLAGTPARIDAAYAARWAARCAAAGAGPGLDDLGALASLVNGLARGREPLPCPVLVLHGDDDPLVPAADAERWRAHGGAVRVVRFPGRGHALLADPADALVADVLRRAARDAARGPVDPAELAEWQTRLPELAGALAAWPPSLHHLRDGPAGRALHGRAFDLGEAGIPEPTILDVAVTTRCNLACRACARTFERPAPRDMAPEDFARLLERVPHALRVVLVGLGEPLLHPQVVELVRHAADLGRRVSLVTNGMLLDRDRGRALLEAGLAVLTVSIDGASQEAMAQARRGADLARILENLRAFLEERERLPGGRRAGLSVFTALAGDTAGEFPAIVDALAPLRVDAVMASDLNFPENAARSLHRALSQDAARSLDAALRGALGRGLPVVSVDGLEELDLAGRYREFLLLRAARLRERAARHRRCRSPWQTLPVGPDGDVTVCDCQPGTPAGNVLREPLTAVWEGEVLRRQRRAMRSDTPPAACLACPRF